MAEGYLQTLPSGIAILQPMPLPAYRVYEKILSECSFQIGNVDMYLLLDPREDTFVDMVRAMTSARVEMTLEQFHDWCVNRPVPLFASVAKQDRRKYEWTTTGDGACFYRAVFQSLQWNSSGLLPYDYSSQLFKQMDVDMTNPEDRQRFLTFLDQLANITSGTFLEVVGGVRAAIVDYANRLQQASLNNTQPPPPFNLEGRLWGDVSFLEMHHGLTRINLWRDVPPTGNVAKRVGDRIAGQDGQDLTILCASTTRKMDGRRHSVERFTASEIEAVFSRERYTNIVHCKSHFYPMPLMELTGEDIKSAIQSCTNRCFHIVNNFLDDEYITNEWLGSLLT